MSKKVAAPAAAEENIKVVIRCRPLSKTELQNQNKTFEETQQSTAEERRERD